MVSYSKTFSILLASSVSAFASAHEIRKDMDMDMSKYAAMLKRTRVNSNNRQSKSMKGKASKGGRNGSMGAVYTMTNAAENEILVYSRNGIDGELTFEASEPTTGNGGERPGIGASSIIVAGECLLATNTGSHDITTFRIQSASEIVLAGKFASGGTLPLSIAEKEGVVYALNAGNNGSIQGYYLNRFNCGLIPIGSPVELRQTVNPIETEAPIVNDIPVPSEVAFTPEGDLLVIIKINGGGPPSNGGGPGSLNIYEIDPTDGSTSNAALTQISVSLDGGVVLPFAYDVDDQGRMLIVDAVSGSFVTPGAVSVFEDGELVERVETGEGASCWIAYQREGACIYTSNANMDSSVSSLTLKNGPLELVDSRAAVLDIATDIRLSLDDEYLYVLSNGNGAGDSSHIVVYKTSNNCMLEEVQVIGDGFTQFGNGAVNSETGMAVYGL